eukprot:gene6121-6739_t
MAHFLDLPQQLGASIMKEWLGSWKLLANLDVAYTQKALRRDFHALFQHQVFQFPDDSYVLEKIAHMKHITQYMTWIASRRVRMYSLYVNIRLLGEVLAAGPFVLPNVRRVTFIGEKRATCTPQQIRTFLSFLPNLSEVDFSRYTALTNPHLAVLMALPPRAALRVLNLDFCDEIMGVTVVNIASKYCETLEELRCVILDEDELASIAQVCQKLKVVSLACDDISPDSLLALCVANPSLESLTLSLYDHSVESIITDELLMSITKVAPGLRSLSIETNGGVTELSFQHIIEHCPLMCTVKTFGYQYVVKQHPITKRKHAELYFGMIGHVDEMKTILKHISLPVRQINAKYAKVKLDVEILHLIADRSGPHLTFLSGDVGDEVNASTIDYLLSHCPNLVTFMLSKFHCLTNDVLVSIPRHCPFIRVLGIECAKKVTDVAMIKALEAFRLNQLVSVGLHYCRSLGMNTLIKASERFPHLDWILVQGTAMHKELVWQAVIIDKKIKFGSKTTIVTGAKKWFQKELEQLPAKNQPKLRLW